MYTSEHVAVTAIRELGVGWLVFPYDDPHRGVAGYCAVKEGDSSQEHIFQWFLFGRALEPEVELLKATDLVAFLQSEPVETLHTCDDPKLRRLGFVSYRHAAEGRAVVRQTNLTEVKTMNPHPRAILMETRKTREGHEGRLKAARAVKPYGWLRVLVMRLVRRFVPLA